MSWEDLVERNRDTIASYGLDCRQLDSVLQCFESIRTKIEITNVAARVACRSGVQSTVDSFFDLMRQYQERPDLAKNMADQIGLLDYHAGSTYKIDTLIDIYSRRLREDQIGEMRMAVQMTVAGRQAEIYLDLGESYQEPYRSVILNSMTDPNNWHVVQARYQTFMKFRLDLFAPFVCREFCDFLVFSRSLSDVLENETEYFHLQEDEVVFPLAVILSKISHEKIRSADERTKMNLARAYSIARGNVDRDLLNYLPSFFAGLIECLEQRPDDLGKWAASICSDFNKKGEAGILRMTGK